MNPHGFPEVLIANGGRAVWGVSLSKLSTTITDPRGSFTAPDVGASVTGVGVHGGTTIASVSSATSAVLSHLPDADTTLQTVWVGGYVLPIGTGTADLWGSFWSVMGVIGGWDSPDVRSTMLPLISADGEIPADLHYRGRSLDISDLCVESPSELAREKSLDLASAALDLVNQQGQIYVGDYAQRVLHVSRTGNGAQGKLAVVPAGTAVKMAGEDINAGYGIGPGDPVFLSSGSLEVYAPDPLKYSVAPTTAAYSGGTAHANNLGTKETSNFVVNLVPSGTDPLTVSNATTAQGLVLRARPGQPAMPAALAIDFYQKIIVDGSGNNRYDLRDLTTPLFTIVPGDNVLQISGGSGSVTWRSAWT